jgi:hypothetical protein
MAHTMLGAHGYASVLSDSPQEKAPYSGAVTYQAPPLKCGPMERIPVGPPTR